LLYSLLSGWPFKYTLSSLDVIPQNVSQLFILASLFISFLLISHALPNPIIEGTLSVLNANLFRVLLRQPASYLNFRNLPLINGAPIPLGPFYATKSSQVYFHSTHQPEFFHSLRCISMKPSLSHGIYSISAATLIVPISLLRV
jgi:hypothetical protein